jgi:chorismate mutase
MFSTRTAKLGSLLAALALGALVFGGTPALAASPAPATAAAFGRLGPLTDLVVRRLLVGDQVAASKFGTDKPIDDPVREQQVLADARQQAGVLGLDPDSTAQFFSDQINASKVVQRGLFARWTAHPDQAPTTKPDLNQIREQLDQLTTRLLRQLVATKDIRQAGVPCLVDRAEAQLSATILDHLDSLHRHALATALHSVC